MSTAKSLVIGLTGGIGSGKTEVSNRFLALGATVVDADVIAKEVVAKGAPALQRIAHHFGRGILLDDGNLNRKKLRNIIFLDDEKKQWLESLLHPIINQELKQQLLTSTSVYTILSSPLLLETQQKTLVDRILVVDCMVDTQISRAMSRDGSDKKIIDSIISKQITRADRLAYANDIIDNNGRLIALDEKVLALHKQYLSS